MSRKVPIQKPGRSETVVVTPENFMTAVKRFLGIKEFAWDLAALPENTKAEKYYTPEDDALSQVWSYQGWGWLNPPYDNITPWVKKCYESNMHVAMLVPASVGSNWWRDYVEDCARIYFLNGRIQFVGHTAGYPKDLALLLYGVIPELGRSWDWRSYCSEER